MKKYFLPFILLLLPPVLHAQGKFFGGNDDGYGSASSALIVLPVTGLELTANPCNKNICLEWTTVQELNSNRFEIEKAPGPGPFVYTGQVPASGNSNSPRQYSFTDTNPFNGYNYYRIKEVDAEGRGFYSKTVSVQYRTDKLIRSLVNPASGELQLQLNNNDQATWVRIFDMNGRTIFSKEYNAHIIKENISHFSAGLYLLQVEINGKTQREKLIITK